MTTSLDLSTVESSTFTPHVDTLLELKTGDRSVTGKLISVSDISTIMTSGRKPFSLIIHAEASDLTQGTYDVEHAALDTLSVFLVPISLQDGKLELEAVFA